jgi:hypothetical protein
MEDRNRSHCACRERKMRFDFLLAEFASGGAVRSSYCSGRIEGVFPILRLSYPENFLANPESQKGPQLEKKDAAQLQRLCTQSN